MDLSSLERRVLKLEVQNRWLRAVIMIILVSVTMFSLLGFTGEDELESARFKIVYASKFALMDPRTNTVRAELSHQVMPGGWAGLTLWDNEGRARAEMKLWEDGSARVSLIDQDRLNRNQPRGRSKERLRGGGKSGLIAGMTGMDENRALRLAKNQLITRERLSQLVQRATRFCFQLPYHVGIDHGRFNALVAEQFLDFAEIRSVQQQVRRKAVAKRVG